MIMMMMMMMMYGYRSKGSSGIGLELAREYLRQGANVTIAARDMKKLQAAHEMLSMGIIAKDNGQKLIHISVDCGKSLSEGSLCNVCMGDRM